VRERPNILVIIVHDLGTRLACYGTRSVTSPNIDRLAIEGVRFANHFSTAPYCSPSRGAIFTGKYPHANGLLGLVNLGWDLPPCNRTLAQVLGQAGYETFLFGLQHEVNHPERLGFQRVETCRSSCCDDVAPAVARFLYAREKSEAPFYVRVGFSETHRTADGYQAFEKGGPRPSEIELPPFLKDTPGARRDFAGLHGCIRRMDAAVGAVLAALDASGQTDNTLVVFTTDHGMAFPRAKATLYDPGLNTALLVRWPGAAPRGGVRTELLSNIDLFSTLVDAANARVPPDVDGRSFLGLLTGAPYAPREMVFAEKNTSPNDIKRCVRSSRWKYIRNFDDGPALLLPTDIEASLTRRDMGEDHLLPRPAVELYDLESDPNERDNLAGKREIRAVEQALSDTLDAWMERTHDPILRGTVPRPPEEAELLRRARVRYKPRIPGPR